MRRRLHHGGHPVPGRSDCAMVYLINLSPLDAGRQRLVIFPDMPFCLGKNSYLILASVRQDGLRTLEITYRSPSLLVVITERNSHAVPLPDIDKRLLLRAMVVNSQGYLSHIVIDLIPFAVAAP